MTLLAFDCYVAKLPVKAGFCYLDRFSMLSLGKPMLSNIKQARILKVVLGDINFNEIFQSGFWEVKNTVHVGLLVVSLIYIAFWIAAGFLIVAPVLTSWQTFIATPVIFFGGILYFTAGVVAFGYAFWGVYRAVMWRKL